MTQPSLSHDSTPKQNTWIYNDGGRKLAGYKSKRADCVIRAIAIATKLPYARVYAALLPDHGVPKARYKAYLQTLGWTWTPTMGIGTGCRVHLRKEELPVGRLIVSVSRHLVAVIDGVIHDNYDPSRNGRRCVYGYWRIGA